MISLNYLNLKTMDFELKSKRTKEIYYIRHINKKNKWHCTCWFMANRPYEKYGYCKHIKKILKGLENGNRT